MAAGTRRSEPFFPAGVSSSAGKAGQEQSDEVQQAGDREHPEDQQLAEGAPGQDSQDHDAGEQVAGRQHAPHCLGGDRQPGQHAHADVAPPPWSMRRWARASAMNAPHSAAIAGMIQIHEARRRLLTPASSSPRPPVTARAAKTRPARVRMIQIQRRV
jgi:hypothetical protein